MDTARLPCLHDCAHAWRRMTLPRWPCTPLNKAMTQFTHSFFSYFCCNVMPAILRHTSSLAPQQHPPFPYTTYNILPSLTQRTTSSITTSSITTSSLAPQQHPPSHHNNILPRTTTTSSLAPQQHPPRLVFIRPHHLNSRNGNNPLTLSSRIHTSFSIDVQISARQLSCICHRHVRVHVEGLPCDL